MVSSSRKACHDPSSAKGSGASHKQVVLGVVATLDDMCCPKNADESEIWDANNITTEVAADDESLMVQIDCFLR